MSGRGVEKLIDDAAHAESLQDLRAVCAAAAGAYEFDHYLFGSRLPSSLIKPYLLEVNGQPREWRKRYARKRYLAVDPTVRHCLASARPLVWDEILDRPGVSRPVRRFMADAARHGLAAGLTLPLRGPRGETSMLSFTAATPGAEKRAAIMRALPELHLVAVFVQEAASRLAAAGALPFRPSELTPRERECLLWAAEGKTSWETAQILGISERTVIFHLRNVAFKLNVASRQQAIARAIAQGLITPRLY